MPEPEASPATTTRAGLAGAGGGTGLVVLAESLGASSTMREVLVYVAPSVSVIVGAVTFYIEIATKRYLQRRLVKSIRERLQEYLKNPATSPEHKAALVRQLEALEQTDVIQDIERVRIVGEGATRSSESSAASGNA